MGKPIGPVAEEDTVDGLDGRKLRVVSLLVGGMSQVDAAAAVGVDPKTVGRWLQEPPIRREYAAQLAALAAELWSKVLAITDEVWAVFVGHVHGDDPRVSLRACEWYLDHALSLVQLASILREPLTPPLPRELAAKFEQLADAGDTKDQP